MSFLFCKGKARFEDLNAARMSAACEGLTEQHLSCRPFPDGNASKSGRYLQKSVVPSGTADFFVLWSLNWRPHPVAEGNISTHRGCGSNSFSQWWYTLASPWFYFDFWYNYRKGSAIPKLEFDTGNLESDRWMVFSNVTIIEYLKGRYRWRGLLWM